MCVFFSLHIPGTPSRYEPIWYRISDGCKRQWRQRQCQVPLTQEITCAMKPWIFKSCPTLVTSMCCVAFGHGASEYVFYFLGMFYLHLWRSSCSPPNIVPQLLWSIKYTAHIVRITLWRIETERNMTHKKRASVGQALTWTYLEWRHLMWRVNHGHFMLSPQPSLGIYDLIYCRHRRKILRIGPITMW